MRRVAQAANFRHAVYGPSELFYGELYCIAGRRLPGRRSRGPARATRTPVASAPTSSATTCTTSCCFSLPDNDHFSHRHGPQATLASIERADGCLQQLVDAAGGQEQFLSDHAVILMSDHAQIAVSRARPARGSAVRLAGAAAQRPGPRVGRARGRARRALGDGLRARRGRRAGSACARGCCAGCARVEGVDLLAWMEGDEACLWSDRGELRFAPGTQPDRSPRMTLGRGRAPRRRSSWRSATG